TLKAAVMTSRSSSPSEAAVAARPVASRSVRTSRRTPSATSLCAVAAPIPEPAPVISATRSGSLAKNPRGPMNYLPFGSLLGNEGEHQLAQLGNAGAFFGTGQHRVGARRRMLEQGRLGRREHLLALGDA